MVGLAGCSASDEAASATNPQEVQMDSTQGAYSVANPGTASLNLVNTYGDYAFECQIASSTTDEFIRSGETLSISLPAYFIWLNIHPSSYDDPGADRIKQTKADITATFYDKHGAAVSSTTVSTTNWAGDGLWGLTASTSSFTVPANVAQVKFAIAYSDAGDTSVSGKIDESAVRPITVVGGDLPNKVAFFDNNMSELRQRILEGGNPVLGANLSIVYTDYRADTVVDASKLDRSIGTMQAYTRFGSSTQNIIGQIVHEVYAGISFDGKTFGAEVQLTENKKSTYLPYNGRTAYETAFAIPQTAAKVAVYYHVRTYLIVDYSMYGSSVLSRKYNQGDRILLAEKWDNPAGSSSNYNLSVDQPEKNPEMKRTVVFVKGETQPGQDMFVRGGIDHATASKNGIKCTAADGSPNYNCAIPIVHRNLKNPTTKPWKAGDTFLDWYGAESTQSSASQGSPSDWTTNDATYKYTVANDGYGYETLNSYGPHYWMLDVDMDCSKAFKAPDGTRWFEIKSFISNGPGWEADVVQTDAPYVSANHFAKCGMVNVFERGNNTVKYAKLP
jgi:hypothetical protein